MEEVVYDAQAYKRLAGKRQEETQNNTERDT